MHNNDNPGGGWYSTMHWFGLVHNNDNPGGGWYSTRLKIKDPISPVGTLLRQLCGSDLLFVTDQ
jgi:hypothetical protein